jgi:hypothetical protein
MNACKSKLAESALHVVLAANHLAHQPTSPEAVVAALTYLGLAALLIAHMEQEEID